MTIEYTQNDITKLFLEFYSAFLLHPRGRKRQTVGCVKTWKYFTGKMQDEPMTLRGTHHLFCALSQGRFKIIFRRNHMKISFVFNLVVMKTHYPTICFLYRYYGNIAALHSCYNFLPPLSFPHSFLSSSTQGRLCRLTSDSGFSCFSISSAELRWVCCHSLSTMVEFLPYDLQIFFIFLYSSFHRHILKPYDGV